MFHAPRPGENLAIGRIEYVEVPGCINNVFININRSNTHLGLLEL